MRSLPTMVLLVALLLGPSLATALDLTWGSEERLTSDGTTSETGLNHGSMAISSLGELTVAWAERDGPNNNFRIYTRVRSAGGTWNNAELAVDFKASYQGVGLGAKFPAIVTTPGDSLLMVWHDYRIDGINNLELFTKIRAQGEAWGDSTTEVRLTTTNHPETNADNSYMPNLVMDPGGVAHVAWYDYRYDGDNAEILFKSRDGAWDITPGDGPDQNLSNNSGDSHFPALATAPDGTLHAAWRDNTDGSFRIYHTSRPPAGSWGSALAISPAGVAADGVTLATTSDGTLVAAWADARAGDKAIYVRERTPSGAWGAPAQVSPVAGAEDPALAIDSADNRYLAWQDARVSAFNREIFLQCSPSGSPWDSTGASDIQLSAASGKSSRPTLAVSGSNIHVMWEDARHGAPEIEIYFRSAARIQVGISPAPPSVRVAAWPNPFATRLNLGGLPPDVTRVRVLDVQGRRVATIRPTGTTAFWDGLADSGQPVPPGIYFLIAGMRSQRSGDDSWVSLGKIVRSR